MNSSSIVLGSEAPVSSTRRYDTKLNICFTHQPPPAVINETEVDRKLIYLSRSLIRIPEIRAAWLKVRGFASDSYQQCIKYNSLCKEVKNDLSNIYIVPPGGFRLSIQDFKFTREGLSILSQPFDISYDNNPWKKKIIAAGGVLYLSRSNSLYEKVYLHPLRSAYQTYDKNKPYNFELSFKKKVQLMIDNFGVKKAKIFIWVKALHVDGFEHSTEVVFTNEDYEG